MNKKKEKIKCFPILSRLCSLHKAAYLCGALKFLKIVKLL